MNTRNVNPFVRFITLRFQSGLVIPKIEFKIESDIVVHGVSSFVRFDNQVPNVSATVAGGFDVPTLSTSPAGNFESLTNVIHLYDHATPILLPAALQPSMLSQDTQFDAVIVRSGRVFNVQTAVSGGLAQFEGNFTIRYNPLQEWLNFKQAGSLT